MEREKAKEWSCMHAKYGWCEKYMEREKEEKNMDTHIFPPFTFDSYIC